MATRLAFYYYDVAVQESFEVEVLFYRFCQQIGHILPQLESEHTILIVNDHKPETNMAATMTSNQ